MDTQKEFEARTNGKRREAFDRWMDEPLTRMTVSMIPSSDRHRDALITLLRSAFETGFNCGGAAFAIDVLDSVLRPRKP